jgi:PAS domain S-box-containing protein
MSINQAIIAIAPPIGSQVRRLAGRAMSFATVFSGAIIDRLLPPGRRVVRIISLASAVMVLFITAFAGLMLREIGESARASSQAHVEQLAKAVTYQLGTTLFMVENTLGQANDEIRARNDPHRLTQLGSRSQVAMKLLADFFFIDADGQVVSAMTHDEALAHRDLSDRDYFRIHFESPGLNSRIGRPVFGRLTGAELIPVSHPVRWPTGELIGVLVAMIDVSVLDRVWKDIGLRPDDIIELIGEDGAVSLRWPRRPIADEMGDDLTSSGNVAGWPMHVIARLDQAAVDRQAFATKRAIAVSATAGSLMVGLFGFLLANRARQAARERDAGDAVRARLLAAVSAMPVEYIEYDRDRRLVLANRAARDASPWRVPGAARGKTVDEVMESYAVHFQATDTAPAWKAWTDQTIADFDRGGVADSHRPDGQWRRSYVSDMPGGGRVVVRVDITEMKRREEQLAAEMERLNSVFQSNGAAIIMLDRDVRVVLANQYLLDLQGKTAAEIIGRPYTELVSNGLDPAIIERWQSASGTERLKVVEFERITVNADGRKGILRVTATPVQDGTGHLRYIVLIGVDDTERRLAEIRLFDSSRLANLGEMATGMAHEINQPLAVIRMAADSLIEELESPEATAMPAELAAFVKAKLDRISKQTERASCLVNELRTVARKPSNDSRPFDLVETVRIADDLLHEQLKAARVEFVVALPPPGLMVRGEASRLQQVIINLVLNARDALLENPARSSTGTLGHIALRVAAGPAGDTVLTIEDDGPGIPAQVLPRLFEPFFTTKPTGKGTGLGLSISYDIIKRMGGDITAENRPEGGARFTIVLPAVGMVGEG